MSTPEHNLAKIISAGGTDSAFTPGSHQANLGQVSEEDQIELFETIRTYGVMLAPVLSIPFPAESQLGQAASAIETNGQFMMNAGGALALSPSTITRPGAVTVRQHGGGVISGRDDMRFTGGVLLKPAQEGTVDPTAYTSNPIDFGAHTWEAKKVQANWALSSEFLARLKKTKGDPAAAEKSIRSSIMPLIAGNFEALALRGDESLALTGTDPMQDMLRTNNGWIQQMRTKSPKLSNDGGTVTFDLFEKMIRNIPQHVVSRADMRFWTHPALFWDWITYLRQLSTDANGVWQAGNDLFANPLLGRGIAPMGVPLSLVPEWERRRAVTASSTFAEIASTKYGSGSYSFAAGKSTLALDVDNLGSIEITFPDVASADQEDRRMDAERVIAIINQAFLDDATYGAAANNGAYGNVARSDQYGNVLLISPDVAGGGGASSEIEVLVPAGGAGVSGASELGFVSFEGTGAVNGEATGNINFGTSVALSPSSNFVWHYTTSEPNVSANGLRMYMKFEQGSDSHLFDMYANTDATILDPNAVVFMDNIRLLDKRFLT